MTPSEWRLSWSSSRFGISGITREGATGQIRRLLSRDERDFVAESEAELAMVGFAVVDRTPLSYHGHLRLLGVAHGRAGQHIGAPLLDVVKHGPRASTAGCPCARRRIKPLSDCTGTTDLTTWAVLMIGLPSASTSSSL